MSEQRDQEPRTTDKGDQLPLSEVGSPGPRTEETRPEPDPSTGSVNLLRGMEALLTQLVAANQPRQSSAPQLVKFDPDEPEADIEGWCKITEVIITSKKIEGADLLLALTQSLKGRAASCLMQLDVSNLTWPRVKETLMAKLAKPMQPRDYFDNILRFQILNKETASEAAMRLWNAVERIPRVEMPEEIKTGFVTAVLCYKDPLIRRELNCQTVTTRAQLCRVLTGVTLKRRLEVSETYDNDMKRFKGNDNRVFKGVCHRCGNPGHKQVDCKRRREDSSIIKQHDKTTPTCYACGKMGHLASTCPNKSNGNSGNGTTKEVHVCQQQHRCARSVLSTSSDALTSEDLANDK